MTPRLRTIDGKKNAMLNLRNLSIRSLRARIKSVRVNSIGGKVTCAFTLVLLVTIGLGFFSIQRLGAVNTAAMTVRNDWLPSTSVRAGTSAAMPWLK